MLLRAELGVPGWHVVGVDAAAGVGHVRGGVLVEDGAALVLGRPRQRPVRACQTATVPQATSEGTHTRGKLPTRRFQKR